MRNRNTCAMCHDEAQPDSILCVACTEDRSAIKYFVSEGLKFFILIGLSGKLIRHKPLFETSGAVKSGRMAFYLSKRTDELLLGLIQPLPLGPMKKIHIRRVERSFTRSLSGTTIDLVDFDEIKCVLLPG